MYQIWWINHETLLLTGPHILQKAQAGRFGPLAAVLGQHFERFEHMFCWQNCSPLGALSA